MKAETKYAYEKRIKELQLEIEKLRPYQNAVIEIKNWLVPFAGDAEKKGFSPNASIGLRIIFNWCLK